MTQPLSGMATLSAWSATCDPRARVAGASVSLPQKVHPACASTHLRLRFPGRIVHSSGVCGNPPPGQFIFREYDGSSPHAREDASTERGDRPEVRFIPREPGDRAAAETMLNGSPRMSDLRPIRIIRQAPPWTGPGACPGRESLL